MPWWVGRIASDQDALAANNGVIPPDAVLLKGQGSAGAPDQVWLLKRASEVEGTDFRDAQPSQDQNGRPNITFTLTTEAGDRFYKYTEAHQASSATPGSMAIVLDNRVREVASINSAIRDRGEIEGGFTKEQATGSFADAADGRAAGVDHLPGDSDGWTEPGSGFDSAGCRGGDCGHAGGDGLHADLLPRRGHQCGPGVDFEPGDFAWVHGLYGKVLTLPGIAGVILTIGMGVDSNVLIFERIREELRAGKTAAAAVEQGFGACVVTIVDTHVTTIVSAAILFLFGSGPVQGFAVTLVFGLLANLFTAVFVSRVIFEAILAKKERGAVLSI